MACHYCENGTDADTYHDTCHAEYGRRVDAGKCPKCGERDSMLDMWCDKCYFSFCATDKVPWYRGYPESA